MKKNEQGHYMVVHPLKDVAEEKLVSVPVTRQSRSTLVILILLRLYVVLMLGIMILAVVRLARG